MRESIKDIEKYLPSEWEPKCKDLKALIRAREIKTAEELLELNLLYLTMGGSFGATASLLNLTTESTMSKKAVYTRIQHSAEWLKWMGGEMCRNSGLMIDKPEWLDKNVLIIDGSELPVKGSKTGDYLLHYAFDLFNFQCRSMEITTTKEGETLTRHRIDKDDIVIADRGYGSIKGMEHVLASDGNFILRYRKSSFKIYDKDGKEINLLSYCNSLDELESTSVNGYYCAGGAKRDIRIVIMRKDQKAVEKTMRRMKRRQSKNQLKEPKPGTVELNKYIILATSLDYSNERILELYRARWQIEEVFYRLKSLFNFGDIPSKKEETAKAWFYGKLFLAVLAETILKTECFSPEEEKLMRTFDIVKLVE